MSDPVPPDEMRSYALQIATSDPLGDDLLSLCEALRIAVGTVVMLESLLDDHPCPDCTEIITEGLTDVRELVDLGEGTTDGE